MARMKTLRIPVSSFDSGALEKVFAVLEKLPEEVQKGLPPKLLQIFIKGLKDSVRRERISPLLATLAGVDLGSEDNAGELLANSMYAQYFGQRMSFVKFNSENIVGLVKTRDRNLGKLWRLLHTGASFRITPENRQRLEDAGFPVKKNTKALTYRPRNLFNNMIKREGKNVKGAIGAEVAQIANRLISKI